MVVYLLSGLLGLAGNWIDYHPESLVDTLTDWLKLIF